jgi:hypothetical protein
MTLHPIAQFMMMRWDIDEIARLAEVDEMTDLSFLFVDENDCARLYMLLETQIWETMITAAKETDDTLGAVIEEFYGDDTLDFRGFATRLLCCALVYHAPRALEVMKEVY